MSFPSLLIGRRKQEYINSPALLTAGTYSFQNEHYSPTLSRKVSTNATAFGGNGSGVWTMCKFDLTGTRQVASNVILNVNYYSNQGAIKVGACHPLNWTNTLWQQRRDGTLYKTSVGNILFDITDIYNNWKSGVLANDGLQIEPVNPYVIRSNEGLISDITLTIT